MACMKGSGSAEPRHPELRSALGAVAVDGMEARWPTLGVLSGLL